LLLLLATGCSSASVGGTDFLEQVDKAERVQIEAALRQAAAAEEAHFAQSGAYTNEPGALQGFGFAASSAVTITVARADATGYCVEGALASQPGAKLHVTNEGAISEGGC
jgi:Tfp pilus assembly protein PilE